jgi:hypothetical protein
MNVIILASGSDLAKRFSGRSRIIFELSLDSEHGGDL